ncbi:two-component regulator propeller domain-containing protein [Nubsella zeaxanthinifaciens]|uniref:hybrid sensor histidine kinase/response regulator n=1 Tax=Nubsella zeaxanthinifaciens TaxID=392412 RepID=UPI003D089C94
MYQPKGLFICLSILFLTCLNISASKAQKQLSFKRITINEGLSQNTVFCIAQDKTGFIWIGTEDGLNKYDGYEFTIYKHQNNDPKSLSHSQINALLEDKKGNFWVGTSDGLNLFNKHTETFSKIGYATSGEGTSGDFISTIYNDSRGNLWIGTYNGLKYYDYESRKLHAYNVGFVGKNREASNRVQTIFEDRNHNIWVSIGKSLKCISAQTKKLIELPTPIANDKILYAANVRAINQTPNGDMWFATEGLGLIKFISASNSIQRYSHESGNSGGIPTNIIRTLFNNGDHELWIGTRDGLSVLNTQSDQFLNYRYSTFDAQSLSHNSIRCILKDRSGNIWLGTYAGGVNFYGASSNNFGYIGQKSVGNTGLTHRVVSSIIADGNGLWIGTEGGGLNYINRSSGVTKSYVINSVQQNIVKSLAKQGNLLWIGTYDGLSCLNTQSNQLINYEITQNDGKPENKQVYAISVTNNGIWLGTDGRGLKFRDVNGNITSYLNDKKNPNTLSGNVVLSLLKNTDDKIWVGTEHGLNYFDAKTGKFKRYQHQNNNPFSLQHNTVLSLFYDSKHRLWVGTEGGGLSFLDTNNGKFYNINETYGLASAVIHAIREDKQGNLWVSTNKGLSKISFKKFSLPFKNENIVVLNYTVQDGLQSNQFTSGAVETNAQGEIFFGGINGVTYFYPEKIIYNKIKPKVVITDFLIKNNPVKIEDDSPLKKSINETDLITLNYDQAFITFKFAALNYINPEKNKYAYKLKGFNDDDWHYVGNQRQATYTNLDAGTYTFEVKAANNDGLWTNQIKSVKIVVLPPWWKTWWAYLLYAAIIGTLLYAFNSYSVKTTKLKHELELQHVSHEKDQELAKRKLSFFTNISHEIKTPLTLILGPIDKLINQNEGNNKTLNQLRLIQRNGERLVRLINQLLDFRKFEEDSMVLQTAEGNIVRFVREVVIAFEPYAQHRHIKLKFSSEQQSLRLWFDRDKLEKVIYNLISNALKFTNEGGQVLVSVHEVDVEGVKMASIAVEDDGIGIPPDQIDRIFEKFKHFDNEGVNSSGTGIGLAFSKGLVQLHRGKINVESILASPNNSGRTVFTMLLPIGNAHLSESEMIQNYKNSEDITSYKGTEISNTSKLALEKRKQQVLNAAGKDKLILLVVEDNSEVRQFVSSHFESNFEIHEAENGKVGIEQALKIIPDIIISDVMMPITDGITLCKTLKTDTRTSHIPVVLLTARTPIIFNIEGLETGADDYITKPFNLNMLEARIWNLLDNRQKLRERYSKEVTLQPTNVAITSPDEKFLEKIMAFIEKNIAEPELSVEELGNVAGMSRVTLYRKIKALTNQTAIEFIRSVRLKRAAQLLQQNKFNVNEVAYMVGFSDVDYFRRCFKEEFKLTPKEYANSSL